tara:strand:- start:771 stop:1442 length:672 start_codon:yes stop_codon:yes gene_type:complete
MAIIEKRKEPKTVNPGLLLLYGSKKSGKTTMLGQLDDCLVIDTENGSDYITGDVAIANNLDDIREIAKEAAGPENKYKYIAIDTINPVIEWLETPVLLQYGAKYKDTYNSIGEIPHFAGWGEHRKNVQKFISAFRKICDCLIIIGHNKAATAANGIVEPETFDAQGKLKSLIMAQADAIGYVHRDDEDVLKVSFKSGRALEAGSRCEHLKGEILDFKWENIFK